MSRDSARGGMEGKRWSSSDEACDELREHFRLLDRPDEKTSRNADDVDLVVAALRQFPDSPSLHVLHGDTLQLATMLDVDVEGVLACYERALEIDPSYAGAWTEIGFTLDVFCDDFEGAVGAFERAIECGSDGEAYAGMARALAQRGDRDDAHAWLSKGLNRFPESEILQQYKREIENGEWDPEPDGDAETS